MLKRIFLVAASMALFAGQVSAQVVTVNGAGASFPFPVYSSWASEYHKATNIRINYQSVGSGAGVRQITEGTVDFGASDDPMTTEDLNKAGLLQFPAIIGGIVPVVNIPGVTSGQFVLTGQVLADIYQGKITKWNDPAIVALNKDVKLPNANISVIYRADSSGTAAVFTEYLSLVSAEWKDKVGAAKAVRWPVGVGAKGNDGVAGSVARQRHSIGFVEYAFAKQAKLTTISLVNAAGKTVYPDVQTFRSAAESGDWDREKAYYVWLVNMQGENAWPIVAASFVLLRKNGARNADVIKFYDWSFKNGSAQAERLGYVPLPEKLKEDIREYWKDNGMTKN